MLKTKLIPMLIRQLRIHKLSWPLLMVSDLRNVITTTKTTIKNAQIILAQDNKKIYELKNTTKLSTW